MPREGLIRKLFGTAKPPQEDTPAPSPAQDEAPQDDAPEGRLSRLRQWRLPLLAIAYVLIYVLVDSLMVSVVRNYIFCVFLVVSSLYFSWSLGGKQTMLYVAFFNIFFAFIFSRLIFLSGGMQYARYIYLSRSFFVLYVITLIFMVIMVKRKSPADNEREERERFIQEQRIERRKLELMVATEKLTHDLVTQANQVKDELLLLQGAWKSQIHSIVNDLPPVKENELYRQIVEPFQKNILTHLRNLETRLSFSPKRETLGELAACFRRRLEEDKARFGHRLTVTVEDRGWADSPKVVVLDAFKTWEILLNLIRNSQSALEFRQLALLKTDRARYAAFRPALAVEFDLEDKVAVLRVTDNGGGVDDDQVGLLFKHPLQSQKRGGKQYGQGTIFVKFFGESMGMDISAANVDTLGERGLCVTVRIPLFSAPPFPVNGDDHATDDRNSDA
jgi:signal transduction histidine kinase